MRKHRVAEAGGRQEKLKKKKERGSRGIRAKPTGEFAVMRRAAQGILPEICRVASIA
jgi:hypothetical protein